VDHQDGGASPPVFFDPTGRRRKAVNRSATVLAVLLAIVTTVFAVSLLGVPFLPQIPGGAAATATARRLRASLFASHQQQLSHHLLRRARAALWREIAAGPRPRAGVRAPELARDTVVAAFYAIWQKSGLHSLRANADHLTHVLPEWLHLTRAGDALDFRDWDPEVTPTNLDVVRIARDHHVDVVPILNNAEGGAFDPARAHVLLASPAVQGRLIAALRTFLVHQGFQGVNVDLENLRPDDYARLPGFLARLAAALGPGYSVSTDLEPGRPDASLAAIAAACDFVVMMAYNQHSPGGPPGPISAVGWYDSVLTRFVRQVPAHKLVVGVANYGFDWRADTTATTLTYQGALIAARDNRPDEPPQQVVDFDPQALNPTFQYTDDSARSHEVWLLDGVTAHNQLVLARRAGVRGAALWVLGSEDPALWRFFDQRLGDSLPPLAALDTISAPYGIEFEGDGEILRVTAAPQRGVRQNDVDPTTGLATDESYLSFPSSYVIRRSGYRSHLLALTFDDGPDRVYTPQILDLLGRLGVPGTFFLVGENIERYPEVVRRIFREGYEIGNHTYSHPNMAAVSRRRATLEINTTQRALQSAIGRSTILFRIPYNADAEPTSAEEAAPLVLASSLGYITVGEQLDPQDWNLWKTSATGDRARRTADDLVTTILRQARTTHGNVILLHSAGGDRTRTVQALETVVPLLQREGYTFVTVSQLLGTTREALMPPVAASDVAVVGFDRLTFEALNALETLLGLAFILAVGLAVARVSWVTPVAIAAHRAARRKTWDPAFQPAVSVLIAAYNERPVINRTIATVLANAYPGVEVIVVDDGSTDGTGEEVAAGYGAEPRVRLIRQENAGKAAALNLAIAEARGEVMVCFDADTQIAPNAIALLARHFADPAVAAVAGNVKVGNRVNILTRWQSLEYITSQNLDRRAYAFLNAVTVVPGAVGAWRRSAVLAVGGYLTDTMAEDMELTWRLRRAGWHITADAEPVGYTEAPDTFRTFYKQRFRWAYGSLQCLWKHRGTLFHYGWFGWLAVPTVWLFQVLFQTLGPLVDLKVLTTLATFLYSSLTKAALTQDWQPLPQITRVLVETLFFYGIFFGVDLISSTIAILLDRERLSQLWWLFWQRFAYRQLMYAVLWKSAVTALKGKRQGWGKLARKGTVAGPLALPEGGR
jgi:cellulose synthase/poly-beta-1,6-N-acetylglucosamine synthase-like glycosyltransferase/spore germination protein YaaH/peptidoglycan/xylan/chitin deacetylase (PgdA/CDA1 family)